jgi:hypothetical protein
MARKEIIPFGVDLNKLPPKEDSLAIVLVEEPLPLAILPLKQVTTMPPEGAMSKPTLLKFVSLHFLRRQIVYF